MQVVVAPNSNKMGVLYSIWGTFHRQGALLWEVNAPTMHVLQAWSLGKDNMSLLKTYYNVLYIHTYVPISVVIPLATQVKLAACVHRTCTNICSAGVRFITQALQTCSKAPPTVSWVPIGIGQIHWTCSTATTHSHTHCHAYRSWELRAGHLS